MKNTPTAIASLIAASSLTAMAGLLPGANAAQPRGANAGQAQGIDEADLRAFTWRSVGPPGAGGRIVDVEVVGDFPHTIFIAGATGGLWRSTNNGVTFEPLFDDQRTNSIGDIAVHPGNPDVVWVGTGEANARNSVSWGDGVYKTTDGGQTWTNTGLEDSHHVGRIVIDPTDPDTVYVAAMGHFWGPNEERGLYKTTDGGESWERVLSIDEATGVVDVVMDPGDPATLYAAAYQVRRDAFSGGNPATMYGPGSGIYKTTDGGRSWKELTRGLPSSEKGRIGLSVSPTDPEIVYAIVQTATTVPEPRDRDEPPPPEAPSTRPAREDGGVFRSTDRGESWEFRNPINPRPFYYSQIRVDPTDPDRVYVLGSSMSVSEDGGESFETMRINVHVDHHDLWIDPADPDHLVLGNDGGLYLSYDRGETWDFVNQMALGQFYAIDVDLQDPYHIYGGVQDYMSWGGPSATRDEIGIVASDWYKIMTGDGFQVRVDPHDTDVVYAESQGGGLIRHDRATGQNTRIRPEAPEGEDDYRFNWETPIRISYHDPATLYMGGNMLFRSRDRGQSWEAISPDLTTATRTDRYVNDGEPRKIGSMTALAESPLDPDLIYAGTDDGNLWVTRDGGASWDDRTEHFPGLAGKRWVSRLVASRFDRDRAYATFDGHRNDDFAPYVYASTDAGETWESIAANLPDDEPVRVIREDVENPDLLFVGTEFGAWVSLDRGGSWMRLDNGMPTVAVADLVVHPTEGDLVAGTHGRGAFVMDIGSLQELTPQVAASDLHLFSVEDAMAFRYRVYSDDQFLGEKRWVAENPPYGATISYLVGAAPEETVAGTVEDGASGDRPRATLTITDSDGDVVRELEGPATEGIHRVQWDLRHDVPGRDDEEGGGRGGFGGRGPLAQPGTYDVTLELGGRRATTSVVVEPDPELELTGAERARRWETIQRILPLLSGYAEAAGAAGDLQEELESLEESMEGVEAFDESLQETLDALLEDVRRLAFDRQRTSRSLSGVYREIESSPFEPTETQLRSVEEAVAAHAEEQAAWEELVETRVPALEREMDEKGIPRVLIQRRAGGSEPSEAGRLRRGEPLGIGFDGWPRAATTGRGVIAAGRAPGAWERSQETLSAEEILARSIAHHDPGGGWADGIFRLEILGTRPGAEPRTTRIVIDNVAGRFHYERERDGHTIESTVAGDECRARLDGRSELTAEEVERFGLDCAAMRRTRDYHVYLYGLPMKLRDPGTRIDPEARLTTFEESDVRQVRVTYDPEVGGDTWYFYFDPGSFALVGYRFYHDEAANDGEYIVLDGEIEGAGLRLPRERTWYTNRDDRLLGTDVIQSIEGSSSDG